MRMDPKNWTTVGKICPDPSVARHAKATIRRTSFGIESGENGGRRGTRAPPTRPRRNYLGTVKVGNQPARSERRTTVPRPVN